MAVWLKQACSIYTSSYHPNLLYTLSVENCVITAEEEADEVHFYIHKRHHVLSQFPKPGSKILDNCEKVLLKSKTVNRIILEHGDPYYIKIAIEHYDGQILRALSSSEHGQKK
jgi:hypothetical protein